MKQRKEFGKSVMATALVASMGMFLMSGCSAGTAGTTAAEAETTGTKEVLRVGMECAYAPFNWTQDEATTPDGSKAVKIYDSAFYAYGYDVAVSQMIADQLGMEVEIHKVEWSSIGISLDSGDYDCIIAGMGRTAEREMSYAFTTPYYYRDNCIVVKADGAYAAKMGAYFMDKLKTIPHVKEVRGQGLLVGVEFDDSINAVDVKHECLHRHLLITAIGGHVIRMVPPLIITEEDCDKAYEIIKASVEALG